MLRFWSFFLKKTSFSFLLIIALVVFGVIAAVTLPKESAPEVRVPVGIVTTILPGASAEDIESLITDNLEEGFKNNLDNVRRITSTSGNGASSIVVEFQAEADIDKSIRELKDEVDRLEAELPDEAEDPIVTEINFADQPVITFAIAGDLPEPELIKVGKDVADEIKSIRGVSRVDIAGERDREVQVVVRREALTRRNLTLDDVVGAIRASNATLPAGSIVIDAVSYAVSVKGKINDPKEIESISLLTEQDVPLFVRDVADVYDGLSTQSSLSRVSIDGKPSTPALSFNVFKQGGGDITEITQVVQKRLEELKVPGERLENLDTLITFDTGEYLLRDLTNLTRTGIQTVILVMLILFLAIGWREALIAGLAIPLSFLVAFIGLQISGNTINFVSLFSLILAIGILVDSAIVIVEGIHTHMKEWMKEKGGGRYGSVNKREAAFRTIKEFHAPLTAGTLTTVAVFAPLFFISGITGEFISSIPFTVISVLFASLLVALGLVPLIAFLILKRRSTSRLEDYQEAYLSAIQNWYKEKLSNLLANKRQGRIFVWSVVLLFFMSLLLPVLGIVKVEFFPTEDADFLIVETSIPEGSTLEVMSREMQKVEEVLYEEPRIESFVTTVGGSSPFSGDGSVDAGARFGNIFIKLPLASKRPDTSTEIASELRRELQKITSAEVTISEPAGGPPVGTPVVITLSGNSFEALGDAAALVEDVLREIPGAVNVKNSLKDTGIEFDINIDKPKATSLGISPTEVTRALRTALSGTEATTITNPNEDIEVVITLGLDEDTSDPSRTPRTTIENIMQIPLRTTEGRAVLLGSIASVAASEGRTTISHRDGVRVATVSSELSADGNTRIVLSEFDKRARELRFPEGVTFSLGGENEDAEQAFRDMFVALLMGLIFMLAILVIQFNSYRHALYVLSIVPLSLIGVLVGLAITGNALSFPSMLGFIALAGIVVNNSIILIDVMNEMRRRDPGRPIRDIVVAGGTARLRPILLTTLTTVIGLIPLIFASAIWAPLAFSIMFGLMFAVVITLFLVPILYNRKPGIIEGLEKDSPASKPKLFPAPRSKRDLAF